MRLPTCVVRIRFSLRFIETQNQRRARRASGTSRLWNLYRLQLRQHFLGSVLPPRWQMQLAAEMFTVLVAEESRLLTARALHQNSAGRPHVHRIKVVAILDVESVGKAKLFVDALLLFQLFPALHRQCNVMNCTGAEGPASGRAIRLVMQNQGASRTAGSDFKPMVGSLH